MESRGAIRYPLQLPATFSWDGGQGIVRHGEGCTRNISERGVFVDAAICPPIGSSIELHYSLPALPGSSRIMHVHHTGETIRREWAEPGEHSGGFAITSRETVWSYEDGSNFSPSEKEPD